MIITEFNKYKKEPEVKIEYYDNGQKQSEYYYLNGKYHREDGTVVQWWYSNGQKQSEYYYLNGKYHREDGPAYQQWYDNGQKQSEYYYLSWYSNGQKQHERYCLNGKEYSRNEWIKKLKEIKSPHYKEQKFIYDAEKYNL